MDDVKNDPRFAHIETDPRFRSMPKSKRKVKIDSRFQSLFTDSNFSHKTDIDKRGRPVFDWTKKSKHVMERFYELSDSDLESDGEGGKDESAEELKKPVKKTLKTDKTKVLNKAEVKKKPTVKSIVATKDTRSKCGDNSLKRRRQGETLQAEQGSKNKKAKQLNLVKQSKLKEDDLSEMDEDYENGEKETNDEDSDTSEDDGESEDSETNDDDESELPEFTKEFALEETEIYHKWNELNSGAPIVTESTYRFAVCNMDWDFVKAQDLFVLFKSFAPKDGRVRSVSIYPSEFGKERMAEEALLGPREIREGEKIEDDSDNEDKKRKKKKIKDQKKLKQYAKEKEAAQTEKLREYQLNRLKYYYAVVDCDSVRTADIIYSECDGREYQLSSVRLDLRFIPDDMTFEDEPRESFSEEQSIVGYQPAKFNSTALSQAKVDVTWDETEFDRLSRHISSLPPKDLESIVEENKYADIIAPPESDSEDDDDKRPAWLRAALDNSEDQEKELTEEEKIQLYRKVLMDALADNEEEKKKEEGKTDKEIEWQPGLKDKVQKKINKKEKQVDNVIVSGFLEKKKEKKKKKREEKLKKKSASEEGQHAFSDDELPNDDIDSLKELMEGENIATESKKNKKKKQKKLKDQVVDEAEEKAKAELELMVMDEGTSEKKLSKPELVKDSKKKKKKKAKLLKQKNADDDQVEDFKLDVEDPRFSALYTSHLFHIDPTAPQFKKTKNMMKLVDEQIKRKMPKASNTLGSAASTGTNNKPFSQALLESLKHKMKK